MMAAGRANEKGSRVLLLEKNPRLGIKLLMTGKGRCNFSHDEPNPKKLSKAFGDKGRFLVPSFYNFGSEDMAQFLENRGVPVKTERGDRMFPKSDKGQDVLDALLGYLEGADVRTDSPVEDILIDDSQIKGVVCKGQKLEASQYILCTGGKARPSTGSTGDAYPWLKKMGHKIIEPRPALTSIIVKDDVKELEGLSLKNVEISVWQGFKIDSRFGEALFTSEGMSGPIIIDMSGGVGDALKKGDVELRIDFKPALGFKKLDRRLIRDLDSNGFFKNSLNDLLPSKMIPVMVRLSGINPEKVANGITKEERSRLLHLLKEFTLNVDRVAGFERAIVTAGGVDLLEVDRRTMRSEIIDNLSFAGEILDLDGPTGGYNLQMCWSTGYTAGEIKEG